jgi:hypothetical protein
VSNVVFFDGVDDYVNCGAGASLNINGAVQFTIISRIKIIRSCPLGSWGILSKDGGGPQCQYLIYISAGNPNVINGTLHDGVNWESTPNAPITQMVLYHVAYVLTATRHKIFINGAEVGSPGTARTRNPQNQLAWSVFLGEYAGGHWDAMNIYETQIYNRDLSADEILYNYLHPANPIKRGIQLNLTQDSIQGAQWLDLSGNNNHGTYVNGAVPQVANLLAGR